MKIKIIILKLFKNKKAVSEVLGTILILGIAIALFSVLYLIVLSEPLDSSEPYPTVVAYVEGDHLVVEHRGGDELGVDNLFKFNIGDTDYNLEIGLILDDLNSDGKWNIGERLIITNETIGDDIFDWDNSDVDIFGSDDENNRGILTGSLDIRPSGDIGLDYSIDKKNPQPGDTINITLTVSLFYSDLSVPNVEIMFKLPDELEFLNKTPSDANYNDITGIWNITNLNVGDFFTLTVEVGIKETGLYKSTQLCMLIDGSGSIRGPGGNEPGPDWGLTLNGLSKAVNDSMPHDGTVELTVIQFAENEATLELLEPVVISESNYQTVSADIRAIGQRGSWTPMSCGIQKGADTMFASPNNPSNGGKFDRKVIFLVTDGQPTCRCNLNDTDPYISETCDSDIDFTGNTKDARNYLLYKLGMEREFDEFDALAIGLGPNITWLKEDIVWPGSNEWIGDVQPEPGWVRHVEGFTEFSNAIDETFILIFSKINFPIELYDTPLIDLSSGNNKVDIIINPSE